MTPSTIFPVRLLACVTASQAAKVNTATPRMLWVPLRWPPLILCTSHNTVSVKNPRVREMVEPCSSMSGAVAAPAVNTAPASRAGPLTCSTGAIAVNTSAPLRA